MGPSLPQATPPPAEGNFFRHCECRPAKMDYEAIQRADEGIGPYKFYQSKLGFWFPAMDNTLVGEGQRPLTLSPLRQGGGWGVGFR